MDKLSYRNIGMMVLSLLVAVVFARETARAQNLRGGTYQVEQISEDGQRYTSTWRINVRGNRIQGDSDWDCCPRRRTDPINGKVNGREVRITRDCSGKGAGRNCTQVFEGRIEGDVIQGDFTYNGGHGGRWVLYLRGTGGGTSITGEYRPDYSGSRPSGSVVYSGAVSNRASNKCLDVKGGSRSDGADIQQYDCHGRENQQWEFVRVNNKEFAIVNRNSGRVLDVENQSTSNNAGIQQSQWRGGDTQRWRLEREQKGYFQIVNVRSGKCLDVRDASDSNGAKIQQYKCHGRDNQLWRVEGR